MAKRAEAKPVTAKNVAMSRKHLRESVAMNTAHRNEHDKAIKEDKAKLRQLSNGTGYGSRAAAAKKAKRG